MGVYSRVTKTGRLCTFKYSEESLEIVNSHLWYVDSMGYAATIINKVPTRLHKLLLEGELIDHIDRDKLNNKLSNLRVSTKKQNCLNTGMFKNNTSGYKGVYYCKGRNKWVAEYCGRKLGRFNTKEEAYARRQQEERSDISI